MSAEASDESLERLSISPLVYKVPIENLEKIEAEVIQENIETGQFETNQTLEKGKSARTQL